MGQRYTTFELWQLSHMIKDNGVSRVLLGDHCPCLTKCNVDASIVMEEGRGATGVVLRDQSGHTYGVRAWWCDHCLNALSSKAMTCRNEVHYTIE
jgi:hypothetical protein